MNKNNQPFLDAIKSSHIVQQLPAYVLYIILFHYNYSSDTSNTSNNNSNLYLFPIFKSIPPFFLLPLPCYYHLSPYFLITAPCLTLFPALWLSLINLPLPYCTILQATPLHLSVLCCINHSYFIVILQFVNCSQLPTMQAPLSVYSCDQLWLNP